MKTTIINGKKVLLLLSLFILLYAVQHVINFLSYDSQGPSWFVIKYLLAVGFEDDLARAFYWYILQIIISLALIKGLIRKPFHELGFNFNNIDRSIRYIGGFVIAFTCLLIISWILLFQIYGLEVLLGGAQPVSIGYMARDIAIFGLLPGPGEEPLYRVFVIQFLLMTVFTGYQPEEGKAAIWVVLLSSAYFAFGHIYIFSFFPFSAKFNTIQLITAFLLGIFYAVSYLRTNSILAAVVCHNYSDLIVRIGIYILLYQYY